MLYLWHALTETRSPSGTVTRMARPARLPARPTVPRSSRLSATVTWTPCLSRRARKGGSATESEIHQPLMFRLVRRQILGVRRRFTTGHYAKKSAVRREYAAKWWLTRGAGARTGQKPRKPQTGTIRTRTPVCSR